MSQRVARMSRNALRLLDEEQAIKATLPAWWKVWKRPERRRKLQQCQRLLHESIRLVDEAKTIDRRRAS